MQIRLFAAVLEAFAGAVPHAAFGRLRIRHISTINYNFRAEDDTGRKSIVKCEAGVKTEEWEPRSYSAGSVSSRSSPEGTN